MILDGKQFVQETGVWKFGLGAAGRDLMCQIVPTPKNTNHPFLWPGFKRSPSSKLDFRPLVRHSSLALY